jgi:hypothetical protein
MICLSRRAFLSMCLATALVCAAITPAAAQTEDPEALIRQGVELRRRGEDSRAQGYFRRAYKLAATPRTAAQLGMCELATSDYVDAEQHLSEALADRDAWVSEHKKAIEESRAKAHQHLLRVEFVAAPKGTMFVLEGAEARTLPADGVVWAAAGLATSIHLVVPDRGAADVTAHGSPGETQRFAVPDLVRAPTRAEAAAPAASPPEVAAPAASPPEVAAPAASPSPPPSAIPVEPPATPAAASGRSLRIAGLVTAGVGIAVGVTGAVLLSQGLSKRDAIVAAAAADGAVRYDPADGNWETLRNAGVGCLVGGGIAVVGGAALYFVGRGAGEGQGTVAFVPGTSFGVLFYRRSF